MRLFGFRSRIGVTAVLAAGTLLGAAAFEARPQADASTRHERYSAQLSALNPDAGPGAVSGQAQILVEGDTIRIHLNARNVEPNIAHAMHIHAADRCPGPEDDVNSDGFVDVIEGLPKYGAILVPLDSDLSSQAAGTFPTATNGGTLPYHEHASYEAMLADLMAVDPNTGDAVVKLAPGEALNLAGRHIVVHGIAASTVLPATVQTLPGLPAQATLPIACGEITTK